MKSFQTLSATFILAIAFAACSNNASDTDAAKNADSVAPAATVSEVDANQTKYEANKKLVTDFTQQLYGDKDSAAIDKYIADNIIQHNPLLNDGKAWLKTALHPFLSNPHVEKTKVDIKQIVADGDKVWVLIRETAPNGTVFARAEIFRIENGKIAENWLVTQAQPKSSANKNGMF